MPITLAFTYDVVTPESASDGDTDEAGFYEPGGWKYPMKKDGEYLGESSPGNTYQKPVWKPGDLKAALESCDSLGISEPSSTGEPHEGMWFCSVDSDTDYRTGAETSYAFHVEGCTLATLRRIARVLQGEPVIPWSLRSACVEVLNNTDGLHDRYPNGLEPEQLLQEIRRRFPKQFDGVNASQVDETVRQLYWRD